VCTPSEAAAFRAQHPEPFAYQGRVMGLADAIAAGASQLVIGLSITNADDPSAAFASCCPELLG